MKVPFLDLKAQGASIRGEVEEAIGQVLDSCAFAGGKFVENFENAFGLFCGSEHAVAVGSGTEALWLTLLALDIGPGDEVITVPNSFIATAEAISLCGAKPVFVDIEEQSYTMDPELIEEAVTPRTRAIIPVHLFGQPADMDPIMAVAARYGLHVIEDACQAHGATYKGRPAGSLGDAACFSFYPGKNLGAAGEGGAIVTSNGNLAEELRILRDHGQPLKYHHTRIGWNGRMDGLQGAILAVKLKHLPSWNESRRNNADIYNSLLEGQADIILPREMPYSNHVYHIYPVRVSRREELMRELNSNGIDCAVHYPVPIHLQKAYSFMGLGKGSFPRSERCSSEFVSLPMFPELSGDQIRHVANITSRFVSSCQANSGVS